LCIKVTSNHRWAVRGGVAGGFSATSELSPGTTQVRTYANGIVTWTSLGANPISSAISPRVFNLTTTAKTFFVAARPEGPWYLVHNTKITQGGDDDPPDDGYA
jgi:hypothetical protein